MHTTRLAAALALALSATAFSDRAEAQNFATTEVAILYGDKSFGDGFFLGRNGFQETSRLTVTLEHFSTWAYGDNFFFVDVFKDFNGPASGRDTDFYGEIWEHFSAAKTLGLSFPENFFIRDVNLGFGLNAGTDVLIGAVGPRVDFNLPWFDFITLGVYAYDNWEDPFGRDLDTTYQVTIVWQAPLIRNDRINLWTQGFVDFIGDQGPVGSQIVWQPQVRLDVGQALGGNPGFVELGFEYNLFDDKFGVNGVQDDIFQAMLVFNLH